MNPRPILELKSIFLNYGTVEALKNINLTFYESEIHAIVGEHGAGKSSIGLIVSGLQKPLSGRIIYNNSSYHHLTFKQARQLGIEIVTQHTPQHSHLFEDFSIAENLFVNNPAVDRFSFSNKKKFINKAQHYFEDIQIALDPTRLLRDLTLPERVLVDILKHLYVKPKVLILDEALETASSLPKILPILKTLKHDNAAIIFITHRIDNIYEYADKATIIRKGELLITDSTRHLDKINLIKLAYTQIPKEDTIKNVTSEFYHLLKYNQAILEKLPVNLIVTDKEHSVKIFNDQAIRYFEIQGSDFYNMPLEGLFGDENTGVFEKINAAFDEKDGRALSDQPISINGTVKITNITINPIVDGNYTIGHMIILEDITEQQKLREQIMFSEKLASVGLLAAGVAHEINNPLAILENCIDFLQLELTDHDQRQAVKDIDEVKSSIAQIVSNLVSFSDSRSGGHEVVDISELIDGIINLVRHYAKHHNTTITFHRQDTLLVEANQNEIKQVILNLIKNSFEAMPDGGDIFIFTELIDHAGSKHVKIVLQDSGHGIEANNLNDIFLPFYSTKKIGSKNLGLGLYMSYTLMQKHHGDIAVKNLEGGGCQFIVLIPAKA